MPSSERARERETLRYYHTWLASSRGYLTPKNISKDDSLLYDAGSPRHEATQRISPDKALVAFAQLGCLRLNVKRGIVTLISSSTSFVIAEATRTISLLSGGQHAKGDELWFGVGQLPREQGVSEHALNPPLYTATSSDGQAYSAPALVISNMALDSRSSGKQYVGNGTSFYAGVPITTKNGFVVGVFTVTDDKVRGGLSIEELQFMQDVASTIMDHLENIRNDTARHRGERMVLGLGAFTEGQTSMHPESKDSDSTTSAIEASSQASRGGSHQSTFKGMTISEISPGAFRNSMERGESPDREDAGQTEPTSTDRLHKVHSDHPQESRLASDSTIASTDAFKKRNSNTVTTDAPLEGSPAGLTPTNQSSMPLELRQMFARAANILRQATGSDGVIFFDAQSANVGNTTPAFFRTDSDTTSASSDDTMSGSGGSSDDKREQQAGYSNRPDLEHEMQPRSYRRQSNAKKCEMLGHSFRLSSVDRTSSQNGFVLKEGELRRFLRRYPKGLVMHFTKDGDISSSDDSNKDRAVDTATGRPKMTPHQMEKKRVIAKELIKVVPGARNVIFFGLWDFSRARWSAGCFVWSSRPERLLHAQEDLVYMKAFANTVMCELNRLEAVASDHAKTSFVANVSHELRSPLHGILGSIEFLQDTAVDPFQASMITTVETCGKTLLDTVNHVLEFAKLSKRSQKEPSRISHGETVAPAHSNLDMDIDLAIVVEEVVEAIYAGQTFRSTGAFHGEEDEGIIISSQQDVPSASLSVNSTMSKFAGAVRLLLDIERLNSWNVRTQPGAVRRIVMNLLGNALKYTEKGLVCVSLQSTKKRSRERSDLSFFISVSDTGKGMSTDFARNHAWEAFSQEDSFAHGVGLGLSIVRHITSSLGGKIDLQSSKGKGTELKISLTVPLSSAPADDGQNLIKVVSQRVNGLNVCILDSGHDMATDLDADLNKRAEDTFRRLITSWFGMKAFRAKSISGVDADFFIYLEPPSAEYILQNHGVGTENTHVPLIIMTSNAFESANLRKDTQRLKEIGRMIDVISQPCGPQKLARAFERCIYQEPFTTSSGTANTSLAAVRIDDSIAGTATSSQNQDTPSSHHTLETNPPLIKPEGVRTESVISRPSSDTPTEALSVSVGGSALSGFSANHFPPSAPSASNEDKMSSVGDGPEIVLRPVLLVDDNAVNLKLLVAFVRKAKILYETAQDGLQALELYKEFSKDPSRAFRAVVMDIQMPLMDGLSATREIRNFELRNRIDPAATIVALTGLASSSSQHEAFEAGVDHFLPKPVKFKEFLKLLEQ